MSFGRYQKTIAAFVTGILGWFGAVIAAHPDNFSVSNSQWLQLAAIVATALGVYAVANDPPVLPPQAK